MPASKIRVGVIGAGRMGERHCRVYSSLGDVEFVGISELSAERGKAIAAKYGVRWFADFADLLPHVDAVSVVTPADAHFEVAAECLRRRVHLLLEKPLTGDLRQASELARMARQAPVVFQAGYIERFNPAFLELQTVLEDMEIVAFNARRLSPFDTSNTDLDVVSDLMIHDIDLALTLLGNDIDRLQAHSRSVRMDTADFVVATFSMAGGPIAGFTASRITEQKVRQIEITALGAYVEADLLNKSICIYRRTLPEYISNHHKPLRYRQEGLVERIHIPTAEPLMLELQDFVRCVRTGAAPRVGVEQALQALELAARIREQIAGVLDEPVLMAV